MVSSLGNLPEEVLCIIFSYCSTSSLCNLALCSRLLYRLSTPSLYEDIDFVRPGWEIFPKLRSLGFVLLQNPELARSVRRFALDCLPLDWNRNEVIVLEKEVVDVYKKSIAAEIEDGAWLDVVGWNGYGSPIVALFLPALARLQSLKLEPSHFDGSYLRKMFWRAARQEKPFDNYPAFEKLTDVDLRWYNDQYLEGLGIVAAFLLMPAMQRIIAHRQHSTEDGYDGRKGDEILAELNTASSSVSHMELNKSRLHDEDIVHLMRIVKKLKTFVFTLGTRHRCKLCPISFKAMRDALELQQDTLKNLCLDLEVTGTLGPLDELDFTEPMAGFGSFKALTRLCIATVFLFGLDEDDDAVIGYWNASSHRRLRGLFPQALETLHLTHCEHHPEHVPTAVADLLLQRPWSLKRLLLEGAVEGPVAVLLSTMEGLGGYVSGQGGEATMTLCDQFSMVFTFDNHAIPRRPSSPALPAALSPFLSRIGDYLPCPPS